MKLKIILKMSDTTFNEISVCLLGNVDSGKSSTLGVLLTDKPDNGNGEARSVVSKHPHEIKSGKTSDIAYHSRVFCRNRVTFADLAGHQKYFKTTLYGLSSFIPDCVVLCVDRYASTYKMTKEHIGLLLRMNIPFILCMTKTDLYPKEVTDDSLRQIKDLVTRASKKRFFEVKTSSDITFALTAFQSKSVIPVFRISNTTLSGIDMLKEFFAVIPSMKNTFCTSSEFMVNTVYRVKGIGFVLCGRAGSTPLHVGDTVFIDNNEECIIKSIHNDHREFIPELPPYARGCLNIRVKNNLPIRIKLGSVVSGKEVKLVTRFKANILVLSNHSTTITNNFGTYIHCGAVRISANMRCVEKVYLRGGQTKEVEFETINPCFLETGQRFFFREGHLIGEGVIMWC
jgi:GTPase